MIEKFLSSTLKLLGVTLLICMVCLTTKARAKKSQGEDLFALCKTCHGEKGEGKQKLGAPKIAGLPAWYSIKQINNFKNNVRGNHVDDFYGLRMRPMAKTLRTDKEIVAVSEFVEKLPSQPSKATIHGDAVAGKGLYLACMTCHGPSGEGNKAMFAPPLTSNDWYLKRQLSNFKHKLRGADSSKDPFGATMAPMALTLADDKAVSDVLTYIGTLKNKKTE